MSTGTEDAREGMARLYPPLAPALLAWANLRLSSTLRRQVSPEDLAQEVWLRAFQVFDSFDVDRVSFRAFLFAVAKRVLLEVQRRSLRHRREVGSDGCTSRLLALDQVPEDVTSLTQRVARDERVRDFVARLARLDETERMTVIYCGLEELSVVESAQRLGEAYDATAKRWQRLRQRMAAWAGALDLVGGV